VRVEDLVCLARWDRISEDLIMWLWQSLCIVGADKRRSNG